MKPLKRFGLTLVGFALALAICDFVVGTALQYGYTHSSNDSHVKLRYIFDSVHQDVLIFGSSRALRHFNPAIMECELNRSVYNCGFSGQGLMFSYILISDVLITKKPQLIIVEVSPRLILDFVSDQRLKIFNPYYGHDTLIRQVLNDADRYEWLKQLSFTYPYNSTFASMALKSKGLNVDGYLPLNGIMDEAEERNTIGVESFNDQSCRRMVKHMQLIRDICREHNIALIFVTAPIYNGDKVQKKLIDRINLFCRANRVPYFDFSDNKNFKERKLFRDNMHLNRQGADLFSRNFAVQIKGYIQR